ncbi:MAG: NnrS family protein [Caulobacterales bacterium]
MTTAADRRAYAGPPVFSFGFRPFFLVACAWPAASVPIWVMAYLGYEPFAGALTRDWHVHEMLFGYLGGVMAGFLLTAVPNWTGRMPVMGAPLAGLAGLWVAGRAAMLISPNAAWAAAVDAAFLAVFALVIWREVVAGRNWRNLPVCILVTLLALANLGVHLRPLLPDLAAACERLALGVAAMMISLIGGRVTPSFTRNWLMQRRSAVMPAAGSRFDQLVLALTGLAAAAWIAAPDSRLTGAVLAAAGAANLARLARWRGARTLAEPLVWVLHAGYGWLGLSLATLGVSVLVPAVVPRSAGIHALTVGAIGVMTLAMMTRSTLGHTGRPREAGPYTLAIYLLVNAAAVLRIAASFLPGQQPLMLGLSSLAWSAAFGGFVLVYGPMLLGPRADQDRDGRAIR